MIQWPTDSIPLPLQKRGLRSHSGTERDHHAPLARLRIAVASDLIQHEHHRGRRHIAVVSHHGFRVAQLLIRQAHLLLYVVDDLAAAGMRYPEANVRAGEAVSLEQRVKRTLDHGDRQVADQRRQNDAQLALALLEPDFIDLLGIKKRLKIHDLGQARSLRTVWP